MDGPCVASGGKTAAAVKPASRDGGDAGGAGGGVCGPAIATGGKMVCCVCAGVTRSGETGASTGAACGVNCANAVAAKATCVSISPATLVARRSGVGVRVAASGVAVAVGVGASSSPRCAANHIQLSPTNTKKAVKMLIVSTAEARLCCGGG